MSSTVDGRMTRKTKHTVRSAMQNSAEQDCSPLFELHYYIGNQKAFAKKKIFFYNEDRGRLFTGVFPKGQNDFEGNQ